MHGQIRRPETRRDVIRIARIEATMRKTLGLPRWRDWIESEDVATDCSKRRVGASDTRATH
jgi:hypothetical protein